MPIYCDESGGIGRGVMTLAAVKIDDGEADEILDRFREATGYKGEVKGSRIDLGERALLFELLESTQAKAVVGIAISALRPNAQTDRGNHDAKIYAALLEDGVSSMLPDYPGCDGVIIDDGRYSPELLASIRADIATLVGPFAPTRLELSHRLSGLQIADVIANSFFNRALVNDRQARIAAILEPLLESGRIIMRILSGDRDAE
jgi:Protein of unknown function (DUF3800)